MGVHWPVKHSESFLLTFTNNKEKCEDKILGSLLCSHKDDFL